MKKTFCLTVLVMVMLSLGAIAQTSPQKSKSFTKEVIADKKRPMSLSFTEKPAKPGVNTQATREDQKKHYYFVNPDGTKADAFESNRFIVRLKDESVQSLSTSGKISLASKIQARKEQHRQFVADLSRIQNANAVAKSSQTPVKLLFEFTRTFNGFALEGDEATRQQIKKLSYVASITEDKKVTAIDLASSQIINADDVWADFGVTGTGINIGIIDTGIDYMHQDLGGGLGQSFKVKGGYDFVNEDSDPMDDHSHGTHVAGIAAGNGPGLKGVAPDANLYAYKVLTADGWGWTSWIVAGIEKTVDPDGDPNTDDHLDVANMSLGGPVSADDPMVEAVNNAVAAGVTFVIAAGNSYDYGTIGSPGVAEDAITVGATDFNDYTAYFSSKGPVENTFAIKPDVAAPGVSIYSSVLNNQYEYYNGTSMASPHVAGAAALLLDKNPTWTPAMIKGALMGTADNSNATTIWDQGAGRIDVLAAIQSELVFAPGSISLGVSDQSSSSWVTVKTITLENLTASDQNVTLSSEGESIGSGIDISISPASITIPANSSQEFEITFTIDVETLAMKAYPEAYTGYVVATSASQTVKAPYAFLHSDVVHLELTGELPGVVFVIGTNPGNYYWKPFNPAPEIDLLLPAGTYDFIAPYTDNYWVYKEGITDQSGTIVMDKTDADNAITFAPKDKDGDDFEMDSSATMGTVYLGGPERNISTLYIGIPTSIHISDVTAYGIDMKIVDSELSDPEPHYDITLTTGVGISDSQELTNDSDEFSNLTFVNPSLSANQTQGVTFVMRLGGGWSMFNNEPDPVGNPLTVLTSRHQPTQSVLGTFLRFTHDTEVGWETAVWDAVDDNTIHVKNFWGSDITIFDTTDYEFTFGKTIPRYNASLSTYGDILYLGDFPQVGYFNRYHGERELGEMSYELLHENSVVRSGTSMNVGFIDWTSYINLQAEPNSYKLKLHFFEYFFDGSNGIIDTEISFDSRNWDVNPPLLTTFSLEAGGVATNTFAEGQEATIKIALADCQGCESYWASVDSVSLFYKPTLSSNWQPLTLSTTSTNMFESTVSSTTEGGSYDLRVFTKDGQGNTLKYEVKPAFKILSESGITLLSPINGAAGVVVDPVLEWSSTDATANFVVQVSESNDFSSLLFDEVVGSTEFQANLGYATVYYWRVRTTDSEVWSSTFSFTTMLPTLELLVPAANATDVEIPVTFSWDALEGAEDYQLYVAEDSSFHDGLMIFTVTTASKKISDVSFYTSYYWKVVARFDSLEVSSEARMFTTQERRVELLSPANGSVDQPLTITFEWTHDIACSYLFQLATDSLFSHLHTNMLLEAHEVSVSGLNPATTYFWRVKPDSDEALWSTTFSFTTLTPEIVLISPENNASGVSLPVTLTWAAADDADDYGVYIAKDIDFTSQLLSYTVTDTAKTVDLKHGTYYWKVAGRFGNDTIFSEIRKFSTKTKKVNLISPQNNVVNQPLTANFSWTSEGESSFTLQLSSEKDFKTIKLTVNVSQNSATVAQLTPGKKFFWRVKPAGEFSEWSDANSFETLLPTVSLLAVTQEINTLVDATFAWNAVTDVSNYTLMLSSESDFSSTLASDSEISATAATVTGLTPGQNYFWKVGANFPETTVWSEARTFVTDNIAGVEHSLSGEIAAYPNPTNGLVNIRFIVPQPSNTSLHIINPVGLNVYHQDFGIIQGEKHIEWKAVDEDNQGVSEGFYIAILKTDTFSIPLKIIVKR
jgi:subtilisin family serine protease